MNFKPTSLKLILALLIGIAGGIWSSGVVYFGRTGPAYVFSGDSIIGFIVPLVFIYVIWSLFQTYHKP